MRYIDKDRFDDCKPRDWDRKALAWSLRVDQGANPKDVIDRIGNKWSDIKPGFIREFGWKCWYTEAPQANTDDDVDHYWPKGRVRNNEGDIILDANANPHSGYWWKAYDIDNYRYSSIYSNRSRGPGGKIDFFPIIDEQSRAWTKDCNCDYNHRIILDPCNIEDVALISFEIEPGNVHPIVTGEQDAIGFKKVISSKSLLNLNHESIVPLRLETIKDTQAALRYLRVMASLDGEQLSDDAQEGTIKAKEKLKYLCNRKSPFSAAALEQVIPYRNSLFLADIIDELDLTP